MIGEFKVPRRHKRAGTVEVLAERVYPINPAASVEDPTVATAIVRPGRYPAYRDGEVIYFVFTGQVNERGTSHPVGEDLFLLTTHDTPGDQRVRFPSRRFTPADLAELRAHPIGTEGPGQRLRLHLTDIPDAEPGA